MSSKNRLDVSLARFSDRQRPGVMPFLTAGLPDLDVTARLIRRFDMAGVAAVEVGFPFSDSIADGPVIQDSFHRVLSGGQKLDDLLDTVRSVRQDVTVPLVAMLSYSIVARVGLERFVDRAAEAGFDGLLTPDVPVEEAGVVAEAAASRGLKHIMLVATSTPPERATAITALCSGFVYQVAVAGTTGERGAIADDLQAHVEDLRAHTQLPIYVGFGISTADHVRRVGRFADGVIIGSAIVRRITDAMDAGRHPDDIVDAVGDFVAEMVDAAT